MELLLTQIPVPLTHYTGKPFPKGLALLHPAAAASLLKLETEQGPLRYTDIYRTAELSLSARKSKQGVQPPGFSGHNYGLSIDFDLDGIAKLKGWTYAKLLAILEGYGWYCHRRDGKGGFEAWHFNHLGPDARKYLARADVKRSATWAAPVEAYVQELYGEFASRMDAKCVQTLLGRLKLYGGEVDGRLGPRTNEAVLAFERAWGLRVDGLVDERFKRTLAFVTATRKMVPALAAPA